MSMLLHIAERVLNRPLLITPQKAEVIVSVLSNRIGVNSPEASRFIGQNETTVDEQGRYSVTPYRVTAERVGIITVTGSLVNRGAWIGASSGLTSYEGIQHQLRTAKADAQAGKVRAVILDMHTPGGEAVGALETGAFVRELAAVVPVTAVVNGMAASAGYAIAAGATEIVTTETGVSGSIGVVMLHADYSRALANEGIKPTLIFAGAHKVDANPFEPLTDAVKADLQTEIDAFYEAFVASVAKGRGKRLSAAAVRKTEARTFIGQAAVAVGLADRVGTFDEVLATLSRAPAGRTTSPAKGKSMSENNGAPAAETAGISKADHDKAVSQARADGIAEGTKAATDRFAAILGADGIKGDGGRMQAAMNLAVKAPGMAADEVAAFVTANVAANAGAPTLGQRMAAEGNPNLGSGAKGAPSAPEAAAAAAFASAIERVNARV